MSLPGHLADTLEDELELMRLRVAKLRREQGDARAELERSVYFEARNALLDRPDVRVYTRDDPAHWWVILVVAEFVHRPRGAPEAWVAVWPTSTGQADELELLRDGAEALARYVRAGPGGSVPGADTTRVDLRRVA